MKILISISSFCLLLATLGCERAPEESAEFRLNFQSDDIEKYAQVDTVRAFEFPIEHGPHEDFRNEWWYLTSLLKTQDGREFGAQFTIFRQALAPNIDSTSEWRTGQIYMAHFAISDIADSSHQSFERFSRGHQRIAGVKTAPFRAFMDDWELMSTGDSFSPLNLRVKEGEFALSANLSMTKPTIFHGDQGLSRKGPVNFSYYYSIPRMYTEGTLTTPEGEFEVTGNSWLDREWMSALLSDEHLGWVWFTLQLHDGSDLVFFWLRSKNAENQEKGVGLEIALNGQKRSLEDHEWSAKSVRYWREWPVEWWLKVGDQELLIKPAFDDQLMKTGIQYWEGVVFVMEGSERIGEGYLELTGY